MLRWMDGWAGGWMDGWMDGTDGWVDRWIPCSGSSSSWAHGSDPWAEPAFRTAGMSCRPVGATRGKAEWSRLLLPRSGNPPTRCSRPGLVPKPCPPKRQSPRGSSGCVSRAAGSGVQGRAPETGRGRGRRGQEADLARGRGGKARRPRRPQPHGFPALTLLLPHFPIQPKLFGVPKERGPKKQQSPGAASEQTPRKARAVA